MEFDDVNIARSDAWKEQNYFITKTTTTVDIIPTMLGHVMGGITLDINGITNELYLPAAKHSFTFMMPLNIACLNPSNLIY